MIDTPREEAVPPALWIKQVSRAQLASTLQQNDVARAGVVWVRCALGIRHGSKREADHIGGGVRDREFHVHINARFNLACHRFHALLGQPVPALGVRRDRTLYTRKAVTDAASACVRVTSCRDRLGLRAAVSLVNGYRLDTKRPSSTNAFLQVVDSAAVAGFDLIDIKSGNVPVRLDPRPLALDQPRLAFVADS